MKKDHTLRELMLTTGFKCNQYTLIRGRARTVARQLNWQSCVKCGYDKHIEVAHVKSITEFDLDTPISIINHPTNLLALCPNCHWEHDHKETYRLCDTCSSRVSRNSTKCKKCSHEDAKSTEVNQITKDELQKLVWEMPSTHIAKKFNVADTLINRWCKRYGISKPPRGYWTKVKSTS